MHTGRRIRALVLLPLVAAAAAVPVHIAAGDDSSSGFAAILERQARATFDEVLAYLRENPNAADRQLAYRWLFETAIEQGFEREAAAAAEAYLALNEDDPQTAALARHVHAVGLAADGRLEEALAAFDEQVAGARLREPDAAITLAGALAQHAQVQGNASVAREVYERLSRKFFLNAEVRRIAEHRLAKLELLGAEAPELSVTDVSGRAATLADYEGKVLLVDFWATNCTPCLEEFSSMKRLYAEHHDAGFDVVGISLDPSSEEIEKFQQSWQLPWRLALSSSDEDETRERYRAATIPSTFLVGTDGKIAGVDLHGPVLERHIETLLEKGVRRGS